MYKVKSNFRIIKFTLVIFAYFALFGFSGTSFAVDSSSGFNCASDGTAEECTPINPGGAVPFSDGSDGKQCGKQDGDDAGSEVVLSINIGCRGENWPGSSLNPILDMAFALFRFISAGTGLVVVASIIWAGIQYSTSRGNPQAIAAAVTRITNSFIALLIYIFTFAIINYLVPGGLFI